MHKTEKKLLNGFISIIILLFLRNFHSMVVQCHLWKAKTARVTMVISPRYVIPDLIIIKRTTIYCSKITHHPEFWTFEFLNPHIKPFFWPEPIYWDINFVLKCLPAHCGWTQFRNFLNPSIILYGKSVVNLPKALMWQAVFERVHCLGCLKLDNLN